MASPGLADGIPSGSWLRSRFLLTSSPRTVDSARVPPRCGVEALDALAATGTSLLGTSHRQAPVKNLVGKVREGIRELFRLPDGYEVILGNGGSTAFWDVATHGLIENKSQHLSFGEFSSKFAKAAKLAPWLAEPTVVSSDPGTHPEARAEAGVDVYAFTHNETSTGVAMPIKRVAGADEAPSSSSTPPPAPAACPSTSPRPTSTTSPRRSPSPPTAACGSACSPRPPSSAPSGSTRTAGTSRSSFSLPTAIDNSRKNQTYNTPALATLFLLGEQLDWMNGQGGLDFTTGRTKDSSSRLYAWAEETKYANPFVTDPAKRSQVIGTIDFTDEVDAAAVAKVLRANGIVDTEPYRKLGRNQLRVAMFPAIDPADVEALTKCVDYVIESSDRHHSRSTSMRGARHSPGAPHPLPATTC